MSEAKIRGELEISARVLTAHAAGNSGTLGRMAEAAVRSIRAGGKLLAFGNGGSAADAQHLVAELVGSYLDRKRRPLPALALTVDTSILTAVANDFGFDEVFARQVEALGRPGDIAFGLSTSGNSANVNRALATARRLGLTTLGLAGKGGGAMRDLCDHLAVVPSAETPRIQEAHIASIHVFCGLVEAAFA